MDRPHGNDYVCQSYRMESKGSLKEGSVPIGKPISNTQVYVLDQHLQPVPVEVAGELFIARKRVEPRLSQSAAQTAERFIPNPFGRHGERMYRTGDRVKWRADGNLIRSNELTNR